jgi:hypothetical protein
MLLGAAAILGLGTPAQASDGCGYPHVCIYQGTGQSRPTGRFQDVTSGWQWLSRSFGAKSFRNTRHDDVAYILTTTGRVICVRPGATGGLMNGGATAIRISYRSHC